MDILVAKFYQTGSFRFATGEFWIEKLSDRAERYPKREVKIQVVSHHGPYRGDYLKIDPKSLVSRFKSWWFKYKVQS